MLFKYIDRLEIFRNNYLLLLNVKDYFTPNVIERLTVPGFTDQNFIHAMTASRISLQVRRACCTFRFSAHKQSLKFTLLYSSSHTQFFFYPISLLEILPARYVFQCGPRVVGK